MGLHFESFKKKLEKTEKKEITYHLFVQSTTIFQLCPFCNWNHIHTMLNFILYIEMY